MSNVPKMTFLPAPVPAAPQSIGTGGEITVSDVAEKLKAKFGASVVKKVAQEHKGDPFIVVDDKKLFDVIQFLRDDSRYSYTNLETVSAVDYPARKAVPASEGVEAQPAQEGRVEVIYILLSYTSKHQLVIKAALDRDQPEVDSLCELYRCANWYERECYDLVGVTFKKHPYLKRVLLPEDWVGHPLRKDYIFPEEYNGMKVPL